MRENKIYAFFFFSSQATKQINRIITQDRFPTNVLLYLPLKASEHIQYQRVHSYESNTAFIKKKKKHFKTNSFHWGTNDR